MSFDLVRGNTSPPMPITVSVSGAGVDVSGADSVQLQWAKPDGTVMLTNLTPIDPTEGEYQMDWSAGDTDVIGPHIGEVVVTTGGIVETYPADGSKIIWWVNPSVTDLVDDD